MLVSRSRWTGTSCIVLEVQQRNLLIRTCSFFSQVVSKTKKIKVLVTIYMVNKTKLKGAKETIAVCMLYKHRTSFE